MTQKLLLRATVLACAMLLGMSLQAQAQSFNPLPCSRPKAEISASLPSFAVVDTAKFVMRHIGRATSIAPKTQCLTASGGNNIGITVNVDFADKPYLADMFGADIILISEGNQVQSQLNVTEQAVFDIVPGIYDVIMYTINGFTCYYVIHEKVELSHDTSLTISLSEAIHQISIENYNPDGYQFMVGLGHQNDETGEWIHTVDGNMCKCAVNSMLFKKGYGVLTSILSDFEGDLDENSGADYRTLPFYCFYVNDVSTDYLYLQDRICMKEDSPDSELYCSSFSTSDVNIGVIRNSPEDYYCNEEEYAYSKYGLDKVGQGIVPQITHIYDGFFNEKWAYGTFYNEIKTEPIAMRKIYVNIPYEDKNDSRLRTVIETDFADYAELIDYGNFSFYTVAEENKVFCTPYAVINNEKYYLNLGNPIETTADGIGFLSALYNGRVLDKLQPHPLFMYPASLKVGDFGASCPINAALVRNTVVPWRDAPITDFKIYYIGRYGELRYCDNPHTTETVYYNGELLEDIDEESMNLLGVYERTFLNTNIEVDGLQGKNKSTFHYDMNQNDMTPPSMMMLHFKDNDGFIIDRFATSEEGTIEFTAGDFNSILETYNNQYYLVFDCQPVEVTVEYAPYGTEDWNELAVEEIPELYQMPGWGYFYRGSLAGVTGEGLNGWFDLRFRLQDASGNWMDQVVSPAFRIDDQAYSSVATVGSDNAREVARYNLAGQRVDDTHHGVTIIRMSDGTARKVIQ